MNSPFDLSKDDAKAAYCNGKVIFKTFHAAETTAAKSRARHDAKLQVYKCPICLKYHVGFSMQRRRSMKKVRQHYIEDL